MPKRSDIMIPNHTHICMSEMRKSAFIVTVHLNNERIHLPYNLNYYLGYDRVALGAPTGIDGKYDD